MNLIVTYRLLLVKCLLAGNYVPEGKIALAEGPETALSIAEAQPDWTVYSTFGVSNFAKVRLPDETKSILICADNDGQDSITTKSITRAAEKLSQRGMDVWISEPQKPLDKAKWDFNDTLRINGVAQVKYDLDQGTLHQTANLYTSVREVEKEFKTLLLEYVDMELEQTRLVNAMHTAKLQDTH